jgi:hypothetical protein
MARRDRSRTTLMSRRPSNNVNLCQDFARSGRLLCFVVSTSGRDPAHTPAQNVGLGTFRCASHPPVYRNHGAGTELAIRVGPRVRTRPRFSRESARLWRRGGFAIITTEPNELCAELHNQHAGGPQTPILAGLALHTRGATVVKIHGLLCCHSHPFNSQEQDFVPEFPPLRNEP